MTQDEFFSLKEGDKITGMNGDVGSVAASSTSRNGVKTVAIEWTPDAPLFYFTSNQTIWMHWSLVDGTQTQ